MDDLSYSLFHLLFVSTGHQTRVSFVCAQNVHLVHFPEPVHLEYRIIHVFVRVYVYVIIYANSKNFGRDLWKLRKLRTARPPGVV